MSDPNWSDPPTVAQWAAKKVIQIGAPQSLWTRSGSFCGPPAWILTDGPAPQKMGLGWKWVTEIPVERAEAVFDSAGWWQTWNLITQIRGALGVED